MRLIIEPNYDQLSKWAANYVASRIKKPIQRLKNLLSSDCQQVLHPLVCTKILLN